MGASLPVVHLLRAARTGRRRGHDRERVRPAVRGRGFARERTSVRRIAIDGCPDPCTPVRRRRLVPWKRLDLACNRSRARDTLGPGRSLCPRHPPESRRHTAGILVMNLVLGLCVVVPKVTLVH
jgi:hypothetical protein